MSSLEDLDNLEREQQGRQDQNGNHAEGDTDMKDAEGQKEEASDVIDEEILQSSTSDIKNRTKLLKNDLRIMRTEFERLSHEQITMKEKIKDSEEKIENNRYYLLRIPFNTAALSLSNWVEWN